MKILRPKEGFTQNPLRAGKYRNLPCLCGSGVKTKKCCGQELLVPSELAKELKGIEQMEAEKAEHE
jgi:hypothetical protein